MQTNFIHISADILIGMTFFRKTDDILKGNYQTR